MQSLNVIAKDMVTYLFSLTLILLWIPLQGQEEDQNKSIVLKNFESVNSSINENSFNKLGREVFLLEIDIKDAKFFPPAMKLSQSVYKTSEILDMEQLSVEDFYYLLNDDMIYSGAVVSNNLKDYFFSAIQHKPAESMKAGKSLQLFTSNIKDQRFSKIKRLSFCERSSNYCHPSISANGRLLVFSSDMPGGHGGYDLYAAVNVDGAWSKPYNLGPKVNGLDDELYPSLSNDGFLYFSSDRVGGVGEMDIYVSERLDNGWSAAANLGAPYNSKSYDYGFRILNHLGHGTLTSDRSGGQGIDDIYLFESFDETENKGLINKEEEKIEAMKVEENVATSVTNAANKNFTFNSEEESGMEDKEALVFYYRAPIDYNLSAFQTDKEAYFNTLEVTAGKKMMVSEIPNVTQEITQFVRIHIRGYESIFLTPEEVRKRPLKLDFEESGWKHLPGRVIFSDGEPVSGIKVKLESIDGEYAVNAMTDEKGKFSTRVVTDQDYSVRLYDKGLQVLQTFEFDPEKFDQLILDMTVDRTYHNKILDAIKNIPVINAATSDIDLNKSNEAPVTPLAKEEPVKSLVKEGPVKSLVKEAPVKSLVKEAPVTPLAKEVPVTALAKEEPVKSLVKEAPVTPLSKEVPVTPLAKEEPVKSLVKEGPVKSLVKEAPVTPLSKEVPVKPLAKEVISVKESVNPANVSDKKPIFSGNESGNEPGNFFVIAGTFSLRSGAERRQQLLIEKGLVNVQLIMIRGTNFYKVAASDYVDLNKATQIEEEVKATIGDVYILRIDPKDIIFVQ